MINFITDHPTLLFIVMFIKIHPVLTVTIYLLICTGIIAKMMINVPELPWHDECQKQISQADCYIGMMQAKGKVTLHDFRGLVTHCPVIMMHLRNYLLDATTQEVYQIVKAGGLNVKVLVKLYNFAQIWRKY